jgi:hypothetical protein
MPKPIIITSLRYKRRGQVKALRELCKYLQFRDGSLRREAFQETGRYPDLSDHAQPEHRSARWVDRGLGETYRQIVSQAFDWQGRRTLARTWVISPDPELMRHLPEKQRFEAVRRVTEQTVERWYSDNGWGQAEYSYVIHDKHRSGDGEQMVHAHVITPGTVRVDEAGELGRVDHFVSRAHIRDLHHTAAESFEQELGRVLGRERAQELIAERDARLERERHPNRERQERFRHLRQVADVMYLLKTERASRKAKKSRGKNRRRALQRQAELRMYMRYVFEDRRQRCEADTRRMAIAREQEQQTVLEKDRTRHSRRIGYLTERGIRVPTHAEAREQEERERAALRDYYVSLFLDRGLLEIDEDGQLRAHEQRELER